MNNIVHDKGTIDRLLLPLKKMAISNDFEQGYVRNQEWIIGCIEALEFFTLEFFELMNKFINITKSSKLYITNAQYDQSEEVIRFDLPVPYEDFFRVVHDESYLTIANNVVIYSESSNWMFYYDTHKELIFYALPLDKKYFEAENIINSKFNICNVQKLVDYLIDTDALKNPNQYVTNLVKEYGSQLRSPNGARFQ